MRRNAYPIRYSKKSGESNGFVIISTTMFRFSNPNVGINNIGYAIDLDNGVAPGSPGDKSFVDIKSACARYDWFDPAMTPGSEYGCVSAFELPPGKYVLTYVYALGGGGTSENKASYSFKFSVKRGFGTYFGNLAIKIPDLGKGRVANAVTFDVQRTDRRDRDVPLFLKKHSGFQASDVLYGNDER